MSHAALWLSYQRYGLLLVGGGAGIPLVVAVAAPGLWYVWGLLALVALWPIGFGVQVLGRWPRKLRSTLLAQRRIERGRFRPESVRPYCGDPCNRVVAGEILARAGLLPAERRALIARLAHEQRAAGSVLLMVDHTTGRVVTIDHRGVHASSAPRA